MSKKKEQPTEAFELLFTKTDAAVITARGDARDYDCDLDYLQIEVDKLIERWKEEVMFL
jgi:hypothetical protein